MANAKKGILFIDGFAGPGEYAGGQDGSPILALKTALKNAPRFDSNVYLLFVEHREDRFRRLNTVLSRFSPAIAETYVRALRQRAGAKYVWHFAMKGTNNALIYWLFFCTKSDRGLEEMKKAMRRVDDTGRFVFSDAANPKP